VLLSSIATDGRLGRRPTSRFGFAEAARRLSDKSDELLRAVACGIPYAAANGNETPRKCQSRLGYVAPTVVDRQSVPTPRRLDDLGDAWVTRAPRSRMADDNYLGRLTTTILAG
jgi:hypothetical protein